MLVPQFAGVRKGRDTSRDAVLAHLIDTALKNLRAVDGLRYAAVLAELNSLGFPTVFTDGALPRGVSDSKLLEYELNYIQAALVNAGETYSGALMELRVPYDAARGELVRVDGTVGAMTVNLPAANARDADAHRVNVKLIGGAGPVTIQDAGGAEIDGSASVLLNVPEANLTFKRVSAQTAEFLRGGAKINVKNVATGETITVEGNVYTKGVDWTTPADLAAAIEGGSADLEAEVQGDTIIVQARVVGQDNAALAAYDVATNSPNAAWVRVDGAALNPAAQLNAEGSEYGGYYNII